MVEYRKFDGKTFFFATNTDSEKHAQQIAQKWRKQGCKARIVKDRFYTNSQLDKFFKGLRPGKPKGGREWQIWVNCHNQPKFKHKK